MDRRKPHSNVRSFLHLPVRSTMIAAASEAPSTRATKSEQTINFADTNSRSDKPSHCTKITALMVIHGFLRLLLANSAYEINV